MDKVVTSVPNITLADLYKLADRIKKNTQSDETEISFEFIIASLFPTSWKYIQADLNRQYTLGYIQGKEDERAVQISRARDFSEADCYCE